MNVTKKELLIYAIIAVVVVVGVIIVAGLFISPTYGVNVSMQTLSPSIAYPYQQGSFLIFVNNTGSTNIDGMIVAVYLNSAPLHDYQVSVPSGKSVVMNFTYPFMLSGNYSFQVVADPGNVLNVVNRNHGSSAVQVTVKPAQTPDIYSGIPNNGINSTESFTTGQFGLLESIFINTRYNFSEFDHMLGLGDNVTKYVLADVTYAGTVANANGGFANYQNGTKVYSMWMQGSVTPLDTYTILSSFSNIHAVNKSVDGMAVTFAKINATTSECTFYDRGWVKLLEYYNNSLNGTCASMVQGGYSSTESNTIVSLLKKYPDVGSYQSKLIYPGTNISASALIATNNTIASFDMFYNHTSSFVGYIKANSNPINVSAVNAICDGPVYPLSNGSVCTMAIVQTRGTMKNVTYVLLNTTQFNENYTLHLYSIINSTDTFQYAGAADLFFAGLNVSGPNVLWNSHIKNTCGFDVTGLGCNVVGYNFSTDEMSLRFTNDLSSQVQLSNVTCLTRPDLVHTSVAAVSIMPRSSANVSTVCFGSLPVMGGAPSYSYYLRANTLINGATSNTIGNATIANVG
ncbi:MAG: hypothetical protein M1504_02235 [Candidatus Marsarchaeota archaeon]|nr:hypothetical protein [Candidatus Marsarchaeota archaeon]